MATLHCRIIRADNIYNYLHMAIARRARYAAELAFANSYAVSRRCLALNYLLKNRWV